MSYFNLGIEFIGALSAVSMTDCENVLNAVPPVGTAPGGFVHLLSP
jgi:hypothetical protein